MLDREVRGKFKEFQEKSGKYTDLEIDEVRFEKVVLEKVAKFPAKTRITGGTDISIDEYVKLDKVDKSEYFGLVCGTVENNQISGYVHKSRLKENSLSKMNSISWTRINSEMFFLQKKPVCTNDDSFIMEVLDSNHIEFILYATMITIKSKNFNWVNKAGKNKVKIVPIPIPKDLNEKYTSFKIQEAIVEFFEYSFEQHKKIKETIDKRYALFERLDKALIPSTFMKDYVKVAFTRYAKEHEIDLDIMDVEFEVKRIHSSNKDEVICKKRMGFSPKSSNKDDINWFRVEDLNATTGLFIDNPNTVKKTTIEKVVAKNGQKSSKNVSIQKGDILVSFLATPGIVKVYNSDKVAYCNQAIDILSVNDDMSNRYIAYNCMIEYPKYGKLQTMGLNLNDEDKKKIKIFIPKDLENYSSLEIQETIANFIETMQNKIQQEFDRMDKAYKALERLHTAYLARTFTLIDWGER